MTAPPGFREIEGAETYWVGRDGRIWSDRTGKFLKTGGKRYPGFHSSVNGTLKNWLVHRVVAFAFLGPPPDPERTYVLHGNGNPQDNRVENLRWGTQSENLKDSVMHGNHYYSNREECSRGHRYTEQSTWIQPQTGYRYCKTCIKTRRSVGLSAEDPRHGTPTGYVNCGCRCNKCRIANRDYRRERSKRKPK